MPSNLPQKYQKVAKALIPFTGKTKDTAGQMALISIDPALPCFLCNQPADDALITPSTEHFAGGGTPWLTFPICKDCEERQIKSQTGHET